jgi:hypothetical protein
VSNTHMRWRNKFLLGTGGAFPLVVSFLLIGAVAAQASTCLWAGGQNGDGYYYSAQCTTWASGDTCATGGSHSPSYSYDGVEGSISAVALQVASIPNSHNIQTLDQQTPATDCNLSGDECWIQNGYGIGDVGGTYSANYPEAYFEDNSWYAYVVDFWPSTTFSLAQDNFYQNYWNGQSESGGGFGSCDGKSGLGEFDTYVDTHNGQGPTLMWYGWLDGFYCTQVYAGSEMEVLQNGQKGQGMTCPTVPAYEYYGTNGSGGVTSYDQLKVSYTGQNSGWFSWQSSSVPSALLGPNSPYGFSYLQDNSAFETWGS